MRYVFYHYSGQKNPSGLTSGKPPFSFRGPSGTAFFLNVYFIAKLLCLKTRRKSDPIRCSKASQKGKTNSPLDFHKMSSLKFLTEIRYFSLCELRLGGIWLQPVIWLLPGRLLPAPQKVQNSKKTPSGLTSGKPYFSFRGPSGTAVFWSTQNT